MSSRKPDVSNVSAKLIKLIQTANESGVFGSIYAQHSRQNLSPVLTLCARQLAPFDSAQADSPMQPDAVGDRYPSCDCVTINGVYFSDLKGQRETFHRLDIVSSPREAQPNSPAPLAVSKSSPRFGVYVMR